MEILKLKTGDVIQILGISEDLTEVDSQLTLTSTPVLVGNEINIEFTYPSGKVGDYSLPVELESDVLVLYHLSPSYN